MEWGTLAQKQREMDDALRLFRSAADQEQDRAQNHPGALYNNGQGAQKDNAEARPPRKAFHCVVQPRCLLLPKRLDLTPKKIFAHFPSSPRGKRWCVGFASPRIAYIRVLLCLTCDLAEWHTFEVFLIEAESTYRFFSSE